MKRRLKYLQWAQCHAVSAPVFVEYWHKGESYKRAREGVLLWSSGDSTLYATYKYAVLELNATYLEWLKELRNRLAIWLWVDCRPRRGYLSRCEVRDVWSRYIHDGHCTDESDGIYYESGF